MKQATDKPTEKPAKGKIYEAPKLVRYGDLVEVTRSVSNHGANDGGTGANHRTA